MADLTDTLSGWDALEDTTSANGYIGPSDSSLSSNPMANVGTYLQAGGDILSGIGGYMQGQETASADEYNASLALIQGQFENQQLGLEESQTLGTQKAMYAKAGVELSGSVLDTALQTATNFEYDKQVVDFNSQSQANVDEYDAKMAKSQGDFALASGLLKGATSLAMASGGG